MSRRCAVHEPGHCARLHQHLRHHLPALPWAFAKQEITLLWFGHSCVSNSFHHLVQDSNVVGLDKGLY